MEPKKQTFTIQPCGRASGGHDVSATEEEGLQVHVAAEG